MEQTTFYNKVSTLTGTKRVVVNSLGLTVLSPLFFGWRVCDIDNLQNDDRWNGFAYSDCLEKNGHLPISVVTVAMLIWMVVYTLAGMALADTYALHAGVGVTVACFLMLGGMVGSLARNAFHYCLPKVSNETKSL